jgi:hypothetical protein
MSLVFPEHEPDVRIEPLSDGPTEVLCRDALSFFVKLEVGATCDWSFYDWPERVLTMVSHTRVAAKVLYQGLECLDVRDLAEPEEDTESRSLYHVADEHFRCVLMEGTRVANVPMIEEADQTLAPLRLCLGDRWTGHEVYSCGERRRGDGNVQHRLVDGAFRVQVRESEFRCLRQTWWELNQDGAGAILAEIYVADFGRSVFWQRYNGPTWRNYEALAGLPERTHEGITYRLWYDCIPDVALLGAER